MSLTNKDITVLDAAVINKEIGMEGTFSEEDILEILGLKYSDLQRIFVQTRFLFMNETPADDSDTAPKSFTLTHRWRQLKSCGSYVAFKGDAHEKRKMEHMPLADNSHNSILLEQKHAKLAAQEKQKRRKERIYRITVACLIIAFLVLAYFGKLKPLEDYIHEKFGV